MDLQGFTFCYSDKVKSLPAVVGSSNPLTDKELLNLLGFFTENVEFNDLKVGTFSLICRKNK